MMHELNPSEFYRALAVFQGDDPRSSRGLPPFAVLEGRSPGRVFVDDPHDPATAFIWSRWGYFYLAGEARHDEFNRALHERLCGELLPQSVALGERWPVLYPFSEAWGEKIGLFLGDRAYQKLYRRSYTLNLAAFSLHRAWRKKVLPGFCMRRVDQELLAQTGDEIAGPIQATWISLGAFLSQGLGYCLLHGERVVSLCLACFAARGKLEISINTAEEYRRQGLATLTAAAFIEECLERGLQPNWECWWTNTPSTALAEKLGFEQGVDHPVYYWEEGAT